MKKKPKLNTLKLAISLCMLGLMGCGSSGDSSEKGSSDVSDVSDVVEGISQGINEQNFVTFTSAVYSTTLLDTGLPTLESALALFLMEIEQGKNSITNCEVKGTTATSYSRELSFGELLMKGDTITENNMNCEDADTILNGTSKVEVLFIDDREVDGAEYNEAITLVENNQKITKKREGITDDNLSRVVVVSADYNDDAKSFSGLNINNLDPIALASYFPSFSTFIQRVPDSQFSATFGVTTYKNFSRASSTTQVSTNDQVTEEVTEEIWDFEAAFSNDDPGYRAYTTSLMVIREIFSEDVFESQYLSQGDFRIEFKTGEVVSVSSSFTDDTTVSFDREGDGVIDAEQTMTWKEFKEAFFVGIFIPALL